MEKKKQSFLYPAIFMIVLSAILTFALAFLNEQTKPVVAMNQEVELQSKILYVFDIDTPSDDPEEISRVFEENVEEEEYNGQSLYKHVENGETVAYAVPFDGPGLWGSIDGYVGVTEDLTTTTGIEFITQSETPGLGGRIGEEPYKSQFRGIDISNPQGDRLIVARPAQGGNIDAISGATQTSTYVENMVNEDLGAFIEDMKGGQ